jgi:uncharacterized Rossmann fold enzyme
MPLISETYRELNRQLHAENASYGTSGAPWAPYVMKMVETEGHASVLDYGCGKGDLATVLDGRLPLAEYDPAIEGKDATPEPADFVVCTDVLEHIEPVHLNAVLRDLRRVTKRKLFVNISTVPSKKTLADGRNAHLIVEKGGFWKSRLLREFKIAMWEEAPGSICAELFPRTEAEIQAEQRAPLAQIRKRRPLSPQWQHMFDEIRRNSAAVADAFSRIETIRMWEDVDDEVADMQVLCRVLDSVGDIDGTIRRAIKLARKAVLIMIAMPNEADAGMWRTLLERHLRISDWNVSGGGLVMTGSPMISVQGVTAVGAVSTDDRFEQVKAACARVSKRIEPTEKHRKRAIIACYGPSLKDTIRKLKEEAAEVDSTVVSVSGAHDFLIENGIAPHMHIECDPRPHKALNIARSLDGVAYYIGSCCHPDLFDRLEGADIRLWHVQTAEHQKALMEMGESPQTIISGGGSVGLRSIPLLYALGYRDFSIYGMDCSFSEDGAQWAGQHAGKSHDVVPVQCGQRVFKSSPILLTYATNMFETVQRVGDATFTFHGDGLLQSMAALYAAQVPQAA